MYSLKTKLSFAIAMVVLITVALISFLANVFIEKQFNNYILRQQELKKNEIVSLLSQQYNKNTGTWNVDLIHSIGMSALYEGYIIKVYDVENNPIWDAQKHDMSLCAQVIHDISKRMEEKQPLVNGEFTSKTFQLTDGNETLGYVDISYFGPYFLSENDFKFLDALNIVLILIGVFSLLLSVLFGIILAKRISQPILKTVDVTKKIAGGNYNERINEKTKTKEIDILIKSINHLAFSLENQEALRKQLTEDVSHELRTPIAILQSHIEAMIDGVWEPTKERLASCNDEIKRIGSLVSDLEKLHNLDSENLELHKSEINLADIIHSAAKKFDVALKEKNLAISINGNCSEILADVDRISQVAINLISNAVKYSKEGGRIDINIFETNDSVGFNVTDNGIGIHENELPFIFERFYRADKSRNRNTGGSGLGLSIVKSIVEGHGGKISVKSKVDSGSSFEVILPKNKI
ncbi:MAG TPA: HAMP domain-containing histidine kinase [Clostridiales bacterium]|nr:HAMP domain-containing histidine kinase [Clostridiales bacterium]